MANYQTGAQRINARRDKIYAKIDSIEHSKAKSKALEEMKQSVRTKRIAGQTNYIVGGHYFNDKTGAHHFAKTGKTLKGQEAR